MKLLSTILIVILSFGTFAFAQSEQNKYKPVTKFDPQRDAAQDIQNAVEEAKRTNRRILLDVGGEWCIWCHRLDDFIESNENISDFLQKNYIVVKINYSKENENKEVLSKFPEIPGYPHFFVLDKNGNFLYSQGTGELEKDKGHDPEKIMNFLKKWAPEKS